MMYVPSGVGVLAAAMVCVSHLQLAQARDYYSLLGVSRNASEADIAKAYRRKARKLHPDVAPGKEEEFKEINTAYEVLRDSEKRQQYDMYGEAGPNVGGSQSHGQHFYDFFRQGGGGGGRERKGGSRGFAFDMNGNMFDNIFEHFNFGRGRQGRQNTKHTQGEARGGKPHLFEGTIVEEISTNDFKASLESIRAMNMYYFYMENCRHCHEGKQQFVDFATNFKGAIRTYGVNCNKNNDICGKYKIDQVPQVIAFTTANKPIYYRKQGFTEHLVAFANQHLPSHYKEVSNRNELNGFLFQDDNMLKVVAIIKRGPYLVKLKALAKDMNGKIKFAFVRASNSKMVNLFGPRGRTDTGVLIPITDVDSLRGNPIDLGPLDYNDMILKLNLVQYQVQRSQGIHGNNATYSELNSRKMSKGECTEKDNHFCFVFVKFGKSKEDVIHDAMFKIAERYSNDPIKVRFVNANEQGRFVEAFGISTTCPFYKACAKFMVYRGKRRKYEIMENELSVENIEKFINDVISGAVTLKQTITSVPKIVDTYANTEF